MMPLHGSLGIVVVPLRIWIFGLLLRLKFNPYASLCQILKGELAIELNHLALRIGKFQIHGSLSESVESLHLIHAITLPSLACQLPDPQEYRSVSLPSSSESSLVVLRKITAGLLEPFGGHFLSLVHSIT